MKHTLFTTIAFCFAILFLFAVSPLSAQETTTDPNIAAAERTLSVLNSTAAWTDLFNGENLSGWTGDTDGYVAKDGVLVCQKGVKHPVTETSYLLIPPAPQPFESQQWP